MVGISLLLHPDTTVLCVLSALLGASGARADLDQQDTTRDLRYIHDIEETFWGSWLDPDPLNKALFQ